MGGGRGVCGRGLGCFGQHFHKVALEVQEEINRRSAAGKPMTKAEAKAMRDAMAKA